MRWRRKRRRHTRWRWKNRHNHSFQAPPRSINQGWIYRWLAPRREGLFSFADLGGLVSLREPVMDLAEREGLLRTSLHSALRASVAELRSAVQKRSRRFCRTRGLLIEASLLPNKKAPGRGLSYLAEREGFEPPDPCGSTVFKTAAFDRSATSPKKQLLVIGNKLQVTRILPFLPQAGAPPRAGHSNRQGRPASYQTWPSGRP